MIYPWLTDDTVDLIIKLLCQNPSLKVFEFGAGKSTLWLAERVNYLITIEHDEKWFKKISKMLYDKNYIILKLVPRPYNKAIEEYPNESFDLILIDGRDRLLCAQSAMNKIKIGGYIILDNSERENYKPIFDLYKENFQINSHIQKEPNRANYIYHNWQATFFKRLK
jgi:predicted O-methyltransferase YrrM